MSDELNKVMGNISANKSFDEIKITLASPEQIKAWSHGEVKKPETINYRTFKPEKDGLFCARIFGPEKDDECLCGKYKKPKHTGIICEKCGVEVTKSSVRRERMGHIELAAPVAHIWFLKSLPSRIGLITDIKLKELEDVLYFEKYIVLEPGLTSLGLHQLLTEEEYQKYLEEYGEDAFEVGIGAEAINKILEGINLEEEADALRAELRDVKSDNKRKKIVQRLKLIEAFIESGVKPEWMILKVLPVIPPNLRPLVPLDGGRFATSDLNDLYRRVINRNNRLRRLLELNAPEIIVRNEKRMLQESVDALFDNGRRGRAMVGSNKRPLKSLAEMLKGKQGRFRQNLLGKRVDYSGRSVIVVGPELKLHQCGLPKKMALELFKPFIEGYLKVTKGIEIPQAKRWIEQEKAEVWDALEVVIHQHPVLLNRAPTLHRLGIQAFEPVLIEGKAIQLHPLVCTAFNADFDGDQMAVHVPLSLEAQEEARVLMMSTNNILAPANGKPIIVPTQDMILGLYYLSTMREQQKGEGMAFATTDEVELALFNKLVTYQSKIKCRMDVVNEKGETVKKTIVTTPGRVILSRVLKGLDEDATEEQKIRIHKELSFEKLFNGKDPLKKKDIARIIGLVYRYCGQKATCIFVDRIKDLGYKFAAISGTSFGKDDMLVPASKWTTVKATKKEVEKFEQQYQDGLITEGEKYNKVVDAWSACSDKIKDAMMAEISKDDPTKPVNSVFMMANSGARGSADQMKQLGGMRGLMAKPNGAIIETPIIANFKEGLSVADYFNSSHGARKGLTDTALKTANSGYLTRRLVDVAQDAIIYEEDCGTEHGVWVEEAKEGNTVVATLAQRILGRTLQGDLKDLNGNLIATNGTLVDEDLADLIAKSGVEKVYIRSALTCECKHGVCAKCYGRDLARNEPVSIGEAVGVIAAQSIGEPGTQLTMRTFHVGGTAQNVEVSVIDASVDGKIKFLSDKPVVNTKGEMIVVGRNCEMAIVGDNDQILAKYHLAVGAIVSVKDGAKVEKGQRLVEWNAYVIPYFIDKAGTIKFENFEEDKTVRTTLNVTTGLSKTKVIESHSSEKAKIVVEKDGKVVSHFDLPVNSTVAVEDGQEVKKGDVYATVELERKSRDITGGLPRVVDLFEARKPKNCSIIAEQAGVVSFDKEYKSKQHLIINSKDEEGNEIKNEYLIPKNALILVQEGDEVKVGDKLTDGDIDPHDILRVLGLEPFAQHMINEVQKVYRLQGVEINDKHIEVITRQMLQKQEVLDAGDTTFMAGEQVENPELEVENKKTIDKGGRPAITKPVLLGITKASLSTNSFISAASFQETTRVLTESAIRGRVDTLSGLKENVIVGRLIPAGTGAALTRLKRELEAQRLAEETEEQPAE
ncbi:MAG: DNA-directed RNA polymerase subunit beta' [Alphaproteobacteria bacterium]|nr:DNA-directed RNA polymerase subunit beta' [Alphaproteobacteria bacterium]